MITYLFNHQILVNALRRGCLFVCHILASSFFISTVHAQISAQSCDRFFEPFDSCFERAGQFLSQGQLINAQSIYKTAASNLAALPAHLQLATELNLARIDRWQGKFYEAKFRYNKLLLRSPEITEALIGLGLIAMEEKRFDDSHRYLLQAKQLGDASQELLRATKWLSQAWKYQLTMGAQTLTTASIESRLPIFTLEYALNQTTTTRIGLRALDTNTDKANRLNDFSNKSRVLELGASYTPNNQHSFNVQFDRVYSDPGDYSLKLSYDIKQQSFEAAVFYKNLRERELLNYELRADFTIPIDPQWSLKSAFNLTQENTQYLHHHAQIGARYNLNNNAYSQTTARQSTTRYQQNSSINHQAFEFEIGVKPNKFNAMRLTLLTDKLASKRQANAAWTYEGQPRFELRHEWIQDTAANLTIQQKNLVADLKISVTHAVDFKLSLSHQSLSKTTSALGLLVYRWQ